MKILIKNCLLVDGINYLESTPKDILIQKNIISKIVFPNQISEKDVDEVIDLENNVITPGLMDLHVHSSNGYAKIGCIPDTIGINIGTTTIFDAGTYGADTFDYFYENIITKSVTKVYAWLNVASMGLTTLNELIDMNNIDEKKITHIVNKYKDIIVGLKVRASGSVVGENGINPVIKAKEIAKKLNLPIMVHIGNPPPYVDDVLDLLTEGDVVTHCYHNKKESLCSDAIIRESALRAKQRGVLFDVGHGIASFSFDTAKDMIKKGFSPDFISTDIYNKNIDKPVKSQLYVISKLMVCGLSFADCIVKTTSDIAKKFNIKNSGEIKEGYIADLSVIEFKDISNKVEDSVGKELDSNIYLQHKGVFINGKYYKK